MDSMITIVAPIRGGDVDALNAKIDALGNPCCSPVSDALDRVDAYGGGTHFMSLHAIAGKEGEDAHLVFEITADGDAKAAIARIDAAIGPDLLPVFSAARDWRDNVGLAAYLDSHRIQEGSGYSDPPGLCFAGTPHMSVRRIRDEAALAKFVTSIIDDGRPDVRPIDRLAEVRRAVAASKEFDWALTPPPPPGRAERTGSNLSLAAELIVPFIRAYLWPFAFVLVAAWVFAAILIRPYADEAWLATEWGVPEWLAIVWDALEAAALGFGVTLLLVIIVAITLYSKLRSQEQSDWLDERAPDLATLAEIRKRENFCAQNHMISVTERKPGLVRALTLRLAFWIIAMFATRVYREGFLGGISTIHAARWITIPGTRTLVFFSNFGGSWESYLEDFITRAHEGLTAVWSNSIGFPRTRNLIQDGATDGERFKRYARASMQPTRFWYSAYPSLTTDHVRCNAALRRGLAGALTNDEAKQWLALFGSGARPDSKLETSEIQSLVFGGLGFMKDGSVVLYNLPDDRAKARAFMRGIYPEVGFGDGRKLRHDAIVTVALGPRALEKLGLPDECLKGFAAAFLEGMSIAGRTRILGDIGKNAPENWLWGRDPFDLALLVYGKDEEAVGALCKRLATLAHENDLSEPHRIALERTKKPAIEPFGFVDGVSQPVIRGSYQSFRKNDPIHLVEPGEFIIGYPDNRGNFPPEPELSCLADPDNRLPVADRGREFGNAIVEAPRALARNGSYLVIRQLEQDVGGFWSYCRSEASRLEHRLPAPYDMRRAYIAAKLVGRWPDGSSLVRNPYYPFPDEHKERVARRANRENAQGYDDVTAVAASGEPAGSETARPNSNPPEGTPIAPPTQTAAGAAAAAPAGAQAAGAAQWAAGASLKAEEKTAADEAGAEKVAAAKGEPPAEKQEAVRYSDNDFLFGVEDPEALRCPFGAHIRRANPRDSLMPGSMEQVSISNRHRMLRVGRLYKEEEGRDPGLLFMCLNGDIERQFEFIQQTWLISPSFHGLAGEQDPLTSNCEGTGYVVPTHDGPVRLKPLPQFVTTLGGGYFFMPGRSLLAYLGGL